MSATKTPVLPRTADFKAAGDALQHAYNVLERIEHAFDHVIGPYLDGGVVHELPDFAYIGELYSFVETVEVELDQMRDVHLEPIRRHLRQLDSMRLDEGVS